MGKSVSERWTEDKMAKRIKTGGRKKGSKNKINRQKELQKAAEISGLTPLDYMLTIMRDKDAKDERRDDMAKAVAPYLHARRAPEDKQGRTVPPTIWHRPDLQGPKK